MLLLPRARRRHPPASCPSPALSLPLALPRDPRCLPAGTHVAGTAIGLQVGVAKEAEVVAVRILDCTG